VKKISIGEISISIPDGHQLAEMYAACPTYDFLPWKTIRKILLVNDLLHVDMIDIGANIGDGVAHYRGFSKGKIVCVEADKNFFEILKENTNQFQDIVTVNKLACPSHLVQKVKFSSGSRTGATTVVEKYEDAWRGDSITTEAILDQVRDNFVFKTDTDGFDAEIVKDLDRVLSARIERPSVVFFEGADSQQMLAKQYLPFVEATALLQRRGYEVLILTNYGIPFVYAGTSPSVVRSAFDGLALGYKMKRACCHYFDLMAVREDLITDSIRSGFEF